MNIENIKNVIKRAFQDTWQSTKKNIIRIVVIIIIIILALAGLLVYKLYFEKNFEKTISANEAGQKVVSFINENYLKDAGKAELKEAAEFSTLYKVVFKLTMTGQTESQDEIIYLTKDGKYAFPEMQGVPINLDEKLAETADAGSQITSCESIKKADKPFLDAFVVSQCPYGLQMQRIIAKLVKDESVTKENIKVRYIGSITNGKIESMHGDEEAQENLRQICLREEQSTKYWNYISCYIAEGKSDSCLASVGVDKTNLDTCVKDASRGLEYAKTDFDLSAQYEVAGSPTLILGNDKIDEFSFGGRTEDALKSIICCASNNQADYCSKELSKESATSGFSTAYVSDSTSNSDASCGE
ncbi:hypothetical protein KJ786_01725 [Patescibacteria group bacterium]|nr:hypothetical protein [Patescibacteria group bacterium]